MTVPWDQVAAIALANVPSLFMIGLGLLYNNKRLDDLGGRVSNVEGDIRHLAGRIDTLIGKVAEIDNRITRVEERMDRR